METIWRAVVAAFHVLMETQQYFQHLTTSYTIAQHHPSPGGGTTGRAVHDNTRLPSRQHGADIFLVSANIFAADGGMVGAARDGREVSSLFCTF